jgi:mannan endo-1,6-alpha-mannosidase
MFPSIFVAVTLLIAPSLAQPSPSTLIKTSHDLAISLKNHYPNPSVALLAQPFWWWQSGSAIDALLTYSATTGNKEYDALLQNTMASQTTGTNDFMTVDATGNDDQAWWGLAAMTAAENGLPQAGPTPWLNLARNVFNSQKSRWAESSCGGGMRWKIAKGDEKDGWHYKNSITNGLFFQLAARLAKHTNDAEASRWAEKAYDWTAGVGLIDKEFNVYDGTDAAKGCVDVNHDMWSYNVAVFMHGAAVMAAHTGDKKWTARTKGFIAATKRTFVNRDSGALWERKCELKGECNTDQLSFKGVLARWLGATAQVLPAVKDEVKSIVDKAADKVQSSEKTGLGPMTSFTYLEVVNAALRAQGLGGVTGMIGAKRAVAGRILW